MAIVFAVRGTSTDARYSNGSKKGWNFPSAHTITTDAAALSGSYINLNTAGPNQSISYSGAYNTPNGRAISVLMRIRAAYTGAPSGLRSLFGFGVNHGANGPALLFFHDNTTGAIKCIGRKEDNNSTFANVSFGNWTAGVTGTYYDLVFTWDGTTTANSGKFYIDGTLLGQLTPSNAMTATQDNLFWTGFSLGTTSGLALSSFGLDEFVVWDSVIDPTAVDLVGGSGSLNGASRTALVDVAALEGNVYTDPTEANVKTGTGYTFAGASKTGTYDGSDRWTDPDIDNVRFGTEYKANSLTNNRTGTMTLPPEENVELDYDYGADGVEYTGTLVSTITEPTAAEIAAAVWGAETGDYTTAGTFGVLVKKLLTVGKFLGLK